MSGLARQLQREKQLLEEEILSMSRKMDDEKNMFMATAKAKEMAVAELKLHIVKNDEVLFHFQMIGIQIPTVAGLLDFKFPF